jgi:hypothetical protein
VAGTVVGVGDSGTLGSFAPTAEEKAAVSISALNLDMTPPMV